MNRLDFCLPPFFFCLAGGTHFCLFGWGNSYPPGLRHWICISIRFESCRIFLSMYSEINNLFLVMNSLFAQSAILWVEPWSGEWIHCFNSPVLVACNALKLMGANLRLQACATMCKYLGSRSRLSLQMAKPGKRANGVFVFNFSMLQVYSSDYFNILALTDFTHMLFICWLILVQVCC